MNRLPAICALLWAFTFVGCQPGSQPHQGLKIVCTTSMTADGVQNICRDAAHVESLMGAGVDPHLYKPTLRDLEKLSDADVIVYNGLHLEGKMTEVLKKLGRTRKVIALSDGISEQKLISNGDAGGAHDPHIWFDIQIWQQGLGYIASQLSSIDSIHAAAYEQNFAAYAFQLDSTYVSLTHQWSKISPSQRILITSHDAFSYYGRSFGVEVRALQGISTMSEFGLRDVTEMVDFICERKIPAVFVESSVSDKSLKAVIQGCEDRGCRVKIGAGLYSDAMGNQGSREGTYIGMITYNTEMIIKELHTP